MNIKYTLDNLDCAECALKLETYLKKSKGFEDVSVNFATCTLNTVSSDIVNIQKLINDIEPDVKISISKETIVGKFNLKDIIKEHAKELGFIAASSILLIFLLIYENDLHASGNYILEYILAAIAFLLCGYSVLSSAFKTIIRRDYFDENVLMSIASIGAFAIHALEEAIGVMIFYQIGELLQLIAVKRSRHSIQKLLEIRPDYANVLSPDGILKRTSPQDVLVNDTLIVKPGEKIPLDSIIIDGSSTIDTAVLTGESLPSDVTTNDTVLAGEINLTAKLTIKVIRPFNQSSVSKILTMVEHASEKKAKTENFVTSFAKVYTPIIVVIALLVALLPPLFVPDATFTTWIYRALVLLVISCPCALVISIPLGYFGGIGGASRRGILIKGSNYIDVLANVKHVVFDKTGTLTKGTFAIKQFFIENNFSEKEFWTCAANAELNSNHPIAKSIVHYYSKNFGHLDILPITHTEIAGGGVKVNINGKEIIAGNAYLLKKENITFRESDCYETVLYVAINKRYAGLIILGDEIKPDARETIHSLSKEGIHDIVMLTGDNFNTAKTVADYLSIRTYHAGLLPENKVELLEKIIDKKGTGTVAFVGDGINDAPVLARADVGIAMGALGSDAAIETADVVLMTDHPSKVAEAIAIGKATKAIVIQNIVMSIGVKVFVLLLGIAGFASMWAAVFADVGVALLAVVNASRALHFNFNKSHAQKSS